jgi:acyl carrier protein
MTKANNDLSALKSEIKKLIISSANLQVLEAEIDDNAVLFQGGLGLDSIDLLELVVNIDKKYGLKIQNNEPGKQALKNVESLAVWIHSHQNP